MGVKAYDVAIAGGGIIGCTIALELARAGLRVVVCDRQEPGREASWAAAGMLSPGPDSPDALPLVPLAKDSLARYPDFVAQIEEASGQKVSFQKSGTLELFSGTDAVAHSAKMAGQYAALQLKLAAISADEARGKESSIGPSVSAAAWLPDEATVEPRALISAVIAACKRSGVAFLTGHPVHAILREADRCAGVLAGSEKIAAKLVVIAAGSFCGEIESSVAPTHPVRGQMLALRHPKIQLTCVLRSEKAYLVPRRDGRLIAGSTLENVGFDKQVTTEGIRKILEGVREMVPALVDAEIVESWAGLRPGTADNLPMIGKTDTQGLLVATGHYRNGILLAPATAAIIRDLIVAKTAHMDIEVFSPLRFSSAQATSHKASAAD